MAGTGSRGQWLRRTLKHFHVINSPITGQIYKFHPHFFPLI